MSEWTYKYSETLTKKLKKLKSKNLTQLRILIKKIKSIKETMIDYDHYKNLRHDLKGYKRVHIDKHFVLIFKVNKNNKEILFEDYDHHNNIYRK